MKRLFFIVLAALATVLNVEAREIRVLAIGNSFSMDVVEQHLHELGKAEDVTIIAGNLYIGGCHLQKHLNNLRSEKKAYSYRKVGEDGKRKKYSNYSIQDGLADEQWDYIMVQQVSGMGGIYASFEKYLPEFMSRLRELTPHKPKFIIMQTWAYQGNSQHINFSLYDYNQTKMYKAVTKTYDKVYKDKKYDFYAIVPNGTAIQNGRTYFGDVLTRDGFHLDLRIGRYLGACTLCEVLLGKSVVGNSYKPKGVSDNDALMAQKAAHAAVLKPTKVTKIK